MLLSGYGGRWLALGIGALLLSACAETQFIAHTAKRVKVSKIGKVKEAPSPAATYKIGKPYKIKGVWYYPKEDLAYRETGIASWYGAKFHGRKTANGDIYDMNALTAAHRTLPMPSFVRVTNLENGRSLLLKVNDRGPFAHNRIIDISRRGAQLLGFQRQGTARVRVEILARESRVLASRLTGKTTVLASSESPLMVDRLPKPPVSSEVLAPPPGAAPTPEPPGRSSAVTVADAGRRNPPAPVERDPEPALGVVSYQPVKETTIFIQAGAFSIFENANRVRAMLASLGPVKVTSVLIDGIDLFRVRVGPLTGVAEADRMLERVIQTGYVDSRIIID